MKLALVEGGLDGSACRGPESFNKEEITLAEKKGVLLKTIDSKTAEETYLANICPHCNSFIGQWFFFAHYFAPAQYGDLEYITV